MVLTILEVLLLIELQEHVPHAGQLALRKQNAYGSHRHSNRLGRHKRIFQTEVTEPAGDLHRRR